MGGRVEGKVALITGAARGQGRAHAVRLAEEGADIIAVDACAVITKDIQYPPATPDDLAETARLVKETGRRVVTAIVDIRNLEKLRRAVDDGVLELGKVDIVVANAAITITAPWRSVTPRIFQDTMDVNVTGTWNTVMVSADHLVRNGSGSIILVSSVAGLKGLPFLVPYVASKHAVTGMARAFAHELARHNIRVNSLHPTGVRTPMASTIETDEVKEAMAGDPRLGAMFDKSLSIDVTEPEDQANAVLFLASDESRYVTAVAFPVDAGASQY
jgi:SDR family mycofactocin-dependent oxidoreductase